MYAPCVITRCLLRLITNNQICTQAILFCLGLVVFNDLAFAEEVAAKKADPALEVLRLFVKALSDDSPSLSEEAEVTFSKQELSGTSRTLAIYSLALLRIRDEKFDEAAGFIAMLPEKSLFSPPILRARCYLALQKGDKTESQACLTSLIDLVKNESAAKLDRTETAQFLGGISALSENVPAESRLVPIEPLLGLQPFFELPDNVEMRLAYKRGREIALKRTEELRKTFDSVSKRGADNAKEDIVAYEKSLEEKRFTMQDISEKAKLQVSTHQESNKQEATERSKHVSNLSKLRTYWKQETPGKPSRPSEPKDPRDSVKSSNKSKDDKDSDRVTASELAEYQRDMIRYERDLEKYRQDFPKWQEKDRERRVKINQQAEFEQNAILGLNANAKTRETERANVRKETASIRQEIKELELQLRLTKAVLDEDLKPATLYMPANFDLISYTAESARLERSIPK